MREAWPSFFFSVPKGACTDKQKLQQTNKPYNIIKQLFTTLDSYRA